MGQRFTTALLTAHFLAFAAALFIPRARKEVVTSLDGLLGKKMTRRAAIATVGGAAALVVAEFALAKSASVVKAALSPQRPRSNILLITFDALSAEDMSLYGYRLPTTPNIDAFARKATVFTKFFAGSTFTTSCTATMMTGLYPSESLVFQTQGHVPAANAEKGFPRAMRAGGFSTAAFFSNSNAYYLAESLRNAYDFVPEPAYQTGGLQYLWDATAPLHQNSGIGSRLQEYCDLMEVWNTVGGLPYDLYVRYPAVTSFEHAREMLAKVPDGFFLWVHVMTPHGPYLPDAADRGRFLPSGVKLRTFDEEGTPWKPHYSPDQQHEVDKHRLRYDEFIVTADRAFGSFMADLESNAKLQDTTVIVSADHGESFEGGVYQHESAYQTRPVIHIPLIVRTPGQQDGRTVSITADQTSLAPTILELAGVTKPESMRGPSLVKWLSGDAQGEGEGRAFCQYLEKNSVFKPLHHGTVGVIDGKSSHQYVLDLDTQKGSLRPLDQAQIWNLDRSAENPALAEELRAAIYARFPELVQKPA